MKSISENITESRQQTGSKKEDICPSLILNDVIACNALGRLYQPSSRQIKECCANGYYVQCTLRRTA